MSDGVLMVDPGFLDRVKRDEPMSRHTSWHVGGAADVFFEPRDRADLLAFLGSLPEGTPLFWLGLGSNLLVRDGGIRGVVIDTAAGLTRLERVSDTTLTCEAGVPCARLARQCIKWGMGPAEFLAGIPGVLGGALAMNAGAFGGETWPRVRSVDVCDARGNARRRDAREYSYGYRHIVQPAAGEYFLAAMLEFEPRPGITEDAMRELLAKRKLTQPIGEWSCGSTFTNPKGDHAARLIEAAGLKGFRIGDIMVSPKHANFLVNVEAATAADVEKLVAHIQNVVSEKFGVALTPEFRIAGGVALMRLRHDPKLVRHVSSPADFGRVAVLLGGTSSEREISLKSGNACLAALLKRGVDAHPFDPKDRPIAELVTRKFDRVFIALHGPGGEDGTLQGALEFLGLPYTGSGVMGSAIGMDKLRTKRLAQAVGIPTTDYMVLRSPADLDNCIERLGLPMIVKPATQGSSVGMTKVEKADQLLGAYQAAAMLEPDVFAEPWITGGEYTVAILQGRALPSIRIETPATFYDYQAKYFRNDTKYSCPSGLSAEAEKHLANLAQATFTAVGAEGWGRADFMMDKAGKPYLLEINTVPGMTDHSLVPMAARALDISFEQLVWQVLETSFARTVIA